MTPHPLFRSTGRDLALSWSAFGAAALAVFAWAACCVLPLALSIGGLSLAGTAFIAGQRTWLTLAAAVVLTGAWWMAWRRRKICALDATCSPTSALQTGLLSGATILTVLAVLWPTLIEPWLLALLRTARR